MSAEYASAAGITYARLKATGPVRTAHTCASCGESLWLTAGVVGGFFLCCHGTADHGTAGRDRFLAWDSRCLRFVRLPSQGRPQ